MITQHTNQRCFRTRL